MVSKKRISQSEARLRALTLASSDVAYCMSPDWQTMRELDGKDFLADTQKPNPYWLAKYIHPDDQAYVTGVIQGCIRAKLVFELERCVLRADGSIGRTPGLFRF